ncbi:MAG: right-handed parallel beta-helix repeat-containing protein, partial [Clostridia bacterium]
MSARRLVLAVALFLALSPLAAQQVHWVTTVAEFVQALGPDRVVELAPGRYILSDGYGVDNPAVRWVPVDGGMELQIADSSGLTIRGQGAELVADTPYARTLGFHRGTGLVLEGLTLGHEVSGPCSAGVLGLFGMQDVRVVECDLYGSGSIGIEISDSLGVEVNGGTIRECTAGAVWIEDSDSVFFDEVSMVRNEGSWPLLGVYGSNAVYFSGCTFSDNQGSEFLYYGEGTLDWGFEFCDFAWN